MITPTLQLAPIICVLFSTVMTLAEFLQFFELLLKLLSECIFSKILYVRLLLKICNIRQYRACIPAIVRGEWVLLVGGSDFSSVTLCQHCPMGCIEVEGLLTLVIVLVLLFSCSRVKKKEKYF